MTTQQANRLFVSIGMSSRFFVVQVFPKQFLSLKGNAMKTLLTVLKWIGKQFTRNNKEIDDARTVNDITIQSIGALSNQIKLMNEQLDAMNKRFEHCEQSHQEAMSRVQSLEIENNALKREIIELKVSTAEVKDDVSLMKQVTQ